MKIKKQENNRDKNIKGVVNVEASSNESQDIIEVKRRGVYWNCRPLPYKHFAPFLEYKDELDKYLDNLFAGDIDSNNGDVLDNLIRDISTQAANYLLRQRIMHEDEIQKSMNRLQGDKKAYENELSALRIKLEEINEWQQIYKKLQKKDEILKEV